MKIRKRTDGRPGWQVDAGEIAGRRMRRQFATKRQAENFELELRKAKDSGMIDAMVSADSVAELVSQWADDAEIRAKRGEIEHRTALGYQQHADSIWKIQAAHIPVTSASTTALERLADTIREHSSSVATWRNRWRAVAMALAWGHRKGLVAANNAPAVRINAPRSDREAKGKVPSRAGLRRLVAAIRPDPGARPSLADAYLITALTTGARVSELIALGQDELDLEHGRLSVRRRLEVRSSRVGPPKSRAAFRTIPLSATTVSVLRRWLAIVPRSSSSVIDQVGSPLVFPHASGGFLTHSMVRQSILHPALKAAKLVDAQDNPLYRVHDLRHAAASLMIDARLSVKEIQRVLGHSSATMTLDTYGHLFADDAADRAIAGAIDQALAR